MAAGAAPENHILQLTADSGLDLTAVDGSRVQHDAVDLTVHGNQLIQTGINGTGIDLHSAVADDAVKAGAELLHRIQDVEEKAVLGVVGIYLVIVDSG